MVDVRSHFPSKYLQAHNLKDQDVTLTIRAVVREAVEDNKGDSEQLPVLYFEETREAARKNGGDELRLVLNKTNMKSIAKFYGYEGDDWVGKRVTFFPTTCQAFGDTVDCIRVRPVVPQAEQGDRIDGLRRHHRPRPHADARR